VRPRPAVRPVRDESRPTARAAQLHHADRIACPACDTPIRRLTSGEGALVATCDAKRPPEPGERYGQGCGQALYAGIGPDGVAVTIPLSRDELEILRAGPVVPPLRQALETLGILRTRTPAAVPLHPCSECCAPMLLINLFAGVCRRCAGVPEAPAAPAAPGGA
jgi:hypothetical protein